MYILVYSACNHCKQTLINVNFGNCSLRSNFIIPFFKNKMEQHPTMCKTRMRNIIAAPGKCPTYNHVLLTKRLLAMPQLNEIPDNRVHGAIMGPIWGRQDPGGPHIGPMNFAIWDSIHGEFTTRNRVCRIYDALDFIVTGFLWLCSELLMIYCRI